MKTFNFSERLNLILGSNGDGKTTFFEALRWVLTTDSDIKKESEEARNQQTNEELHKGDDDQLNPETIVSAKMLKDLQPGQSGRVLVQLEFTHKVNGTNVNRIIERVLDVSKGKDGQILILGKHHEAYISSGGRKGKLIPNIKGVLEGEQAFPAVIKKYHIFKGEEDLRILNNKTALNDLVNLYADIKDVDFYSNFTAYALGEAVKATNGAVAKTNDTRKQIDAENRELSRLEGELERTKVALKASTSNYKTYDELIEQYKDDLPAIKRISVLKKEIAEHEQDRMGFERAIDENFGFKLLDDKWILLGFEPIIEEFNRKVKSFSLSKATIENEYRREQEEAYEKQKAEKAKNELEKIVWKMNDIDKMKYILKSHRCAFCGTPVEDGSVQYDFIKKRINDVIELLTAKPKGQTIDIKDKFPFKNIETLLNIGDELSNENSRQHIDTNSIPGLIAQLYEDNSDARKMMRECEYLIDQAKKEISSLNANSQSGMDLVKEAENATDIENWRDSKDLAANEKIKLENRIPKLEEAIEECKKKLKRMAKKTGAETLFNNVEFFQHLRLAIANAEASTYSDILNKISLHANVFLEKLNVDDFRGLIKFEEHNNDVKVSLVDKNGQRINNPNTSLWTTVHLSILLAISEITKEHRQVDYPLIFDAPTSSFDEGKDKTFYECLNKDVHKQCIVVTKSYLYKDSTTNEYVEDKDALSRLNCSKYRIRKLTGFDKLDITTIDTQVDEL